ncbi:MAG: tryptophan-rich sensory protein [Verrucomicrobiae bacterium]|nr:tryptophan-rich sensory protein [Verrucomicrobiae bacterium]
MSAAQQCLALLVFLAATLLAAVIGGAATGGSVREWYPTLAKPPWTPPAWVFGPVWAVLYALMATAAWLAWRKAPRSAAIVWFGIQLALNGAWSPLFFGCRNIALALLDVVALWVAAGITMRKFWKVSVAAGALFAPYWAWVTFAVVLNFAIWRMNP